VSGIKKGRELGGRLTIKDCAEKVAYVEGTFEREVDGRCGRDVCHVH
jgi:hypothetical protein